MRRGPFHPSNAWAAVAAWFAAPTVFAGAFGPAALTPYRAEVRLTTVEGATCSGVLVGLSPDEIVLRAVGAAVEQRLAAADVLDIVFSRPQSDEAAVEPPRAEVLLADGLSRLYPVSLDVDERAAIELRGGLSLDLPLDSVRAIRFLAEEGDTEAVEAAREARSEVPPGGPDLQDGGDALAEQWQELVAREDASGDRLVVERDGVLDFLEGVVRRIDAETVAFELEGEAVEVERRRVFGVILSAANDAGEGARLVVELASGDRLSGQEVRLDADTLVLRGEGFELALPLEAAARIDFAPGRVAWLDELEPARVEYVPYFDIVWEYRRNRNLEGGSLRLAGETYARGLAMHSRTLLTYRLQGEFRFLHAVAGIDDGVGDLGCAQLVVRGDGRVLFDQLLRGGDEPVTLDLDVAGIGSLEVLVDFGDRFDVGDHVDLVEARLIR